MKISNILRYAGILTFGYILLLSLSYSQSVYQPLFTLITFILAVWIGRKLSRTPETISTKVFLGLLLLGAAIRFTWALFIPTLPVSDFRYFHTSALELSQGIPTLTKNMGYTFLLSIGYRIYPSVQTGKIINALASTLSLLLLYAIGKKSGKPSIGLIAVFLFSILPSEINMVSVLGTEVVAATAILIVAFFLLYGIKSNAGSKQIIALCCAGLFYGLGLMVRLSLAFYLPVIVLIMFSSFQSYKFNQKAGALGIFLFGTAIGLGIIATSYSVMAKHISLAPFEVYDSLPYLAGANIKSSGQWNRADSKLYYSWPISERDNLAKQEGMRRITSDPINFLKIVPRKIAILFEKNNYGNLWSLKTIDWGSGNLFGIHAATPAENWGIYGNLKNDVMQINGLLSQAVYCVIWFFAFYAFYKNSTQKLFLIILAIVIFTLLPHIILEVQSRYHHYIMPLVTLQAAYGLSRLVTKQPEPYTADSDANY